MKPFNFKRELGWSDVVAVFALVVATLGYFQSSPLRQQEAQRPRLLVTQAEVKRSSTAWSDRALYIGIRNVGKYPISGLQFVFDGYYLNRKPTIADVHCFLDPPYDHEIDIKGFDIYFRIKNDLPPEREIALSIFGKPMGVTVLTQSGTALYLSSSRTIEVH
jgi:hypothetical protein